MSKQELIDEILKYKINIEHVPYFRNRNLLSCYGIINPYSDGTWNWNVDYLSFYDTESLFEILQEAKEKGVLI